MCSSVDIAPPWSYVFLACITLYGWEAVEAALKPSPEVQTDCTLLWIIYEAMCPAPLPLFIPMPFLESANLGRLRARTSLTLSKTALGLGLRRVAAGEWVRVILKFSLGAWNIKTGPALTFIELADAQSVSEGAWRAQYRRILWVCSAVETAVLMCALSAWRVGLAPVSLANCADKVKLKALSALWLRAEPQKEIFPFSQHTT